MLPRGPYSDKLSRRTGSTSSRAAAPSATGSRLKRSAEMRTSDLPRRELRVPTLTNDSPCRTSLISIGKFGSSSIEAPPLGLILQKRVIRGGRSPHHGDATGEAKAGHHQKQTRGNWLHVTILLPQPWSGKNATRPAAPRRKLFCSTDGSDPWRPNSQSARGASDGSARIIQPSPDAFATR
jgi:hypothetical protein